MNLAEDVWPILIVGGFAALVLGVAFRQTGRKSFAAWAGVAVVLTLLAWLVSWLIVTDREQVAITVETAAGHLRANRDAELMAMIAPDADELRGLANAYLPRVDVAEVVLSDMKVEISEATAAPMATVQVLGRITLEAPATGDFPYQTFGPLPFVIRLQKRGDQWLLTGFRWERGPIPNTPGL